MHLDRFPFAVVVPEFLYLKLLVTMIDAFLLLNLETLVLQILVVVQQVLPHLNQFGPEPLIQLILASLLLP